MPARRPPQEDARLTAVLDQIEERRPGAVGPYPEAVEAARRIMGTLGAVGWYGQAEVYSVNDGEGPEEFVFITGTRDVVLIAECSCHTGSVCEHLLVALAHHGGQL